MSAPTLNAQQVRMFEDHAMTKTTSKTIVRLGVTHAAHILRLSPTSVVRFADEGILPCERDSAGKRTFTEDDVRRLERERNKKQVKTVLQQ
jgi:hypothetical protein